MSWRSTLENRKAGDDPNFIGADESLEDFEKRRAASRAAVPEAESLDPAELEAFRAYQRSQHPSLSPEEMAGFQVPDA
ncbi:MAG: hypothetical protein ACYCVN_12335 [Acidimicrobiales bacterium]